MRFGVLGGTFDPIHLGHLLIAQEAQAQLELELVLFIPVGEPWMKEGRPISAAHHRLAMTRLAIADHPGFRVSAMEVARPGPSYTVETLTELNQGDGAGHDLYFLLGSDALQELPRWREPDRVRELCTLVLFGRPGHPDAALPPLGGGLGREQERLCRLAGPGVEISGTEIRRRVAQGLSIRYQVPQPVEAYIAAHGLYRGGEPPEPG